MGEGITSMGRYALAISLLPLAQALTFSSLTPTGFAGIAPETSQAPQPTASFDDNTFHDIVRRDSSAAGNQSSFTSYTTLLAPASLCGWISDHQHNNSYYGRPVPCKDNDACFFHAPNENWPGMLGCCTNSDKTKCDFYSACHDAPEIKATPSITATSDPLALTCTDGPTTRCMSWSFPNADVTGYACDLKPYTISAATQFLQSTTRSGQSATYYTAAPVSFAADDLISTLAAGGTGYAKNKNGGGDDSKSGGGTNVGAIVGGVVGGIVGLAAIAAAVFVFWLLHRKKQKKAQAAADAQAAQPQPGHGSLPPGPESVTSPMSPSYGPSSNWGGSAAQPSEVDGASIRSGPDAYAKVQPFGREVGQGGPREIGDSKPREMAGDSMPFIAELPTSAQPEAPTKTD